MVVTFPIRWMMYSMIIEIKTKTKQTMATAQVGVSSRDLPPPPPAMVATSPVSIRSWKKENFIFKVHSQTKKWRSYVNEREMKYYR